MIKKMVNEDTLKRFVLQMAECGIVWGIGGSYLLKKYNLGYDPSDLDLWIQASDMPIVRQKFHNYMELKTNIPLPPEYHYKILFDDLEVDFVACFIVKPNQNTFKYSINPENIEFITLNNELQIPCLLLEDWYVIYKLLKKNDKAEKIREKFSQLGIAFNEEVVQKSIQYEKDNRLPLWLLQEIAKVNQLSMFDEEEKGDRRDEKHASSTAPSPHK